MMNFENMLFYLLILLTVPTSKSEVVDFSRCRSFFYKETPPSGFNGMGWSICQRYKTYDYHFATLYNTDHRIPVYSAYTLDTFGCRNRQPSRRSKWFIEPQLSNRNLDANMSTEGSLADIYKQVQAINLDYPNTNYDRGHLNPSFYQCDERRTATFTLTNAVPQDPCFNRILWKQMEELSKKIMSDKCNFHGAKRFFVTGVIPSNKKIPAQEDVQGDMRRDINRVTIPSGMWTAACCDSTHSVNQDDRDKGFSFGYSGDNVPDSYVIPDLVTRLQKHLARLYDVQVIDIFKYSCFSNSKKSKDVVQELSAPVARKIMKTIADISELRESSIDPDKKSLLQSYLVHLNSKSDNSNDQKWRLYDVDVGLRDTRDNARYTRARLTPYGMVPLLMYPNSHAVSKRSVDGSETHDEDEYIIVPSRESSLSAGGSRCRDDHPCGYHKESYQWCYTDWGTNWGTNWDYCCIDKCGLRGGKSYSWCYTSTSKHWSYCSQRSSMIGVEGKRCRADHECGLHGKSYHWCYTDTVDNWQYCCQPWHSCDKYGRSSKWCYVGYEKESIDWRYCYY